MSEQTCPGCGHKTEGPYCSQCGVRVTRVTACTACGSELPAGGRFCNQCGTSVAATRPSTPPVGAAPAAPRPASTTPWFIAGLAILALAVALVFPRGGGSDSAAETTAAGPAASAASEFGDARSVDIAAMTPRERADSLFNRVMRNVSSGDSTQAKFFLPMALSAYEAVPGLDADGHYHMAVLHLAGGDPESARARADSILAEFPVHLFGLFTAAQAEQAMGNAAAARDLYRQLLDRFEDEVATNRAEYSEHAAVMPLMQEEARQALADSSP